MTTPPACRLTEVAKSYGDAAAVRGVSLRIEPGETVALVGPSGAGKTTLLRLLAGLARPDSGEILVHGRSLAGLRPGHELTGLVGMMHQRLDLVPQLSAAHNVQAGLLGRWSLLRSLAALLLPLEHAGAAEAIDRVGLGDKRNRRVSELSGGEQQRVALARLLVQNPRILLADEPISSLDPGHSDDLLRLLCDLADDGERTVVTSLHEPDFARRHFARVVAVRDGRVVFDRPPGEVDDEDLAEVYRLEAAQPEIHAPSAPTVGRATDPCGSASEPPAG